MIRLEQWWAGGSFVEIGGHRYFTRVAGEGETLVFLHGFPTSSHDWADVFLDLAHDHRCSTFDYLGYGVSDKPADADYSSIKQTERALAVLAELGIGHATIIGHDLGGILLQQLLHRSAAGTIDFEIEKAIFSNSSVYSELYRPTPTQIALIDPEQGRQLARQISRPMIGASFPAMFPAHPLTIDQLDDIWTAISRDDGHFLWPDQLVYMRERAEQGGAGVAAMRAAAHKLGFIYGLGDKISGAQILERAASDLPAATCIGLSGLGHYPQLEAPAAYRDALRSLLAAPAAEG